MFNITKYLALRGHEITLVSFAKPGDAASDELKRYCSVHLVHESTSHSFAKILHSYVSGTPYVIEKYQTAGMWAAVESLVKAGQFDCVHADYLMMAPYAIRVHEHYGIPIMLRQHDFETTMLERFAQSEKNKILRIFIRTEYMRMKRYEPVICSRFDLCTMITRKDEERLHALGGTVRSVTIPAGVEIPALAPEAAPDSMTIFFLSSLSWKPNIDGFMWFYTHVLPIVVRQMPDVRVLVAGKGKAPELDALHDPRVEIAGYVDDVAPCYAKTAVCIVPLFTGSGMRIKILEMMAYGKPVVATSIGAEGIHVADGENIFIADDPAVFAEKVVALLKSAGLRRTIGAAARKTVQSEYSWESVAEKFEQAYYPIVNRKGA